MNLDLLLAVVATAMTGGALLGIRWAETKHRIDDDLEALLWSLDLPEPSACAARDMGAADKVRPAPNTPPSGAGRTPSTTPGVCDCRSAASANQAPGRPQ